MGFGREQEACLSGHAGDVNTTGRVCYSRIFQSISPAVLQYVQYVLLLVDVCLQQFTSNRYRD